MLKIQTVYNCQLSIIWDTIHKCKIVSIKCTFFVLANVVKC